MNMTIHMNEYDKVEISLRKSDRLMGLLDQAIDNRYDCLLVGWLEKEESLDWYDVSSQTHIACESDLLPFDTTRHVWLELNTIKGGRRVRLNFSVEQMTQVEWIHFYSFKASQAEPARLAPLVLMSSFQSDDKHVIFEDIYSLFHSTVELEHQN